MTALRQNTHASPPPIQSSGATSFCHNREAVLEMLGRSTEDLAALQCAIRWSDGDPLRKPIPPHPRHPPRHQKRALSLNPNDDLIVVQNGEILN